MMCRDIPLQAEHMRTARDPRFPQDIETHRALFVVFYALREERLEARFVHGAQLLGGGVLLRLCDAQLLQVVPRDKTRVQCDLAQTREQRQDVRGDLDSDINSHLKHTGTNDDVCDSPQQSFARVDPRGC